MPLAVLWLWTTQLAVRIDAWRSGTGPRIAHWLTAIGEFEALCAPGRLRGRESARTSFPRIAHRPGALRSAGRSATR